jgi:hypothetical protein
VLNPNAVANIVIHAGMPKTGSTSIQRWIAATAEQLYQRDVRILVAKATGPFFMGDVRLRPYESGRVNSGLLVNAWIASQRSPAVIHSCLDDLATHAARHRTVLVTAEALAQLFWLADESLLAGLEQLARSHDVRVAYYVRPQHTAIEAGWREGRYKQGCQPAEWVRTASEQLHYLTTLQTVRRLAPSIEFDVRPFRRDLLVGASVVRDFAATFLGVDDVGGDIEVNRGLPLELVNLLRVAPPGLFWNDERLVDTFPRDVMREMVAGIDPGESSRIRRSRLILQAHCHETFEPDNLVLVRRLGWKTSHFVPPAPGLEDGWELSELDELWTPEASAAEVVYFHRAMHAAMTRSTSPMTPESNHAGDASRTRAAELLGLCRGLARRARVSTVAMWRRATRAEPIRSEDGG